MSSSWPHNNTHAQNRNDYSSGKQDVHNKRDRSLSPTASLQSSSAPMRTTHALISQQTNGDDEWIEKGSNMSQSTKKMRVAADGSVSIGRDALEEEMNDQERADEVIAMMLFQDMFDAGAQSAGAAPTRTLGLDDSSLKKGKSSDYATANALLKSAHYQRLYRRSLAQVKERQQNS